jgi:RNA polymerase sigma-B factor
MSESTSAMVDPRFAAYRRTGDHGIRNTLVEDHRWLAMHCARGFARRGEPQEDLDQVAIVGLVKAVDRFDPQFGTAFSTFAVPTILGELRRHFRDKTWSVHVPRRAKELYQAISGVVDELTQVLGRSPTVPEIADRAGITVEDALEALEVRDMYRSETLDASVDDETREPAVLGQEDHGFAVTDARFTVQGLLCVLSTERERQIIRMRFVDGMSQSQIGAEIGLSQVQISRLLRASLDKMRAHLRTDPALARA